MKHYNYGIKAENRLAAAYKRRGHTTRYSEGSRGPSDIFVVRGARRLAIQVKATRGTTVRINDSLQAAEHLRQRVSKGELKKLVAHIKRGWQPAVGLTNGDYYWTFRVHRRGDDHEFELLHDGHLPKRPLVRRSR